MRRVSSMRGPGDLLEVNGVSCGVGGARSRAGSCLPPPDEAERDTPTPPSLSGRATPADGFVSRAGATPPDRGGGVRTGATPPDRPGWGKQGSQEEMVVPKGPARMNTLWGVCIREHAKMCVPDIDVFKNYPIDYRFPAFGKDRNGQVVGSGFFPADPIALHTNHFVGVNR